MLEFIIGLFLGMALMAWYTQSQKKKSAESKANDKLPAIPPTRAKPTPVSTKPAQAPTVRPVKKVDKIERVHVRGVQYHTDNIEAIATDNPDYALTKRELQDECPDECVFQYVFYPKAALVPEPDNEYDPNAIMVQADGRCIGYIPKGSTAHIRKLMASDRIRYMDLTIRGGKYKKVREVDDGMFEMEKGEYNYTAVLELHLDEVKT